jgi:tRNA modification GTPase
MEGVFLARARHLAALRAAEAALAGAAHHLNAAPAALELFAEELRGAQTALATITGRFSADDLLGEIFGRFCIGK